MPVGPGKYDNELSMALRHAVADSGMLIVFRGEHGPGLSVQSSLEELRTVPNVLRHIANLMDGVVDRDIRTIKESN